MCPEAVKLGDYWRKHNLKTGYKIGQRKEQNNYWSHATVDFLSNLRTSQNRNTAMHPNNEKPPHTVRSGIWAEIIV